MNSFQLSQPRRSTGSDSDGPDHVQDQRIVITNELVAIAESFEKKERSWFVTSQIPTDLTIQVHDISFYIHKYPLLSRCGYMSQLDLHLSNSNFSCNLKIDSFPGGPDTFEMALKFCYGLPIDLAPTNIAALRCAAEFLEMTEDFEEGNLIDKTEAFLNFLLSSWKSSIAVLKSCESLSPWAENLQIVRRCSDSIAQKASRDKNHHHPIAHGDGASTEKQEWWFDDASTLRIDYFVRLVTTMRANGIPPEILGACITHYAERWLPGFDGEYDGHGRKELQLSILSGKRHEVGGIHNKDRRMMIESLVSILPPHREAVTCGFLLWMLKMAVVYSAAPALVTELEKRVGIVLEDATVTDLLIPNYINGDGGMLRSSAVEESTMQDVDVVQRIIEYFLMHEQQQHQQKSAKMTVGKLLDGYLAEIARDPNLSIAKFQQLAEALPENARTCHDGLYRAIDTYLKVTFNIFFQFGLGKDAVRLYTTEQDNAGIR